MIDEQTDKSRNSFWKELPILLGVAILVAVLVRAFVLQTFFIPSPSMENTLQIDDRVLVNKLVYDFRPPERGEVVVFKAPTSWSGNPDGEDFIKRVVGIGGDHVVCCDEQGRITINGVALDEPYLYSVGGERDQPADRDFDITVPRGRLWVMGDHRSASGDSLQHWQQSGEDVQEATIPEDRLVGRAFTIFWPLDRARWLSVPEQYGPIPRPGT
ncbi:signal peptidase I [Salinispora mooreana]|uniref:signal peptidase I n=1 Tax=Salinispora mooreana TaxID=999545 RepID=UPI000373DC30|nr:signal peptidase I [Salinispora mooreana]